MEVTRLTLAAAACLLFGAGCQAASELKQVSDVHVLQARSSEQGAFCADFRLTDAAAADSLHNAREISKQQYDQDYDYLPCWVSGTAKAGDRAIEWELRAGGNGLVRDARGTVIYIGCEACRESFGRNAPK